MLYVIINVNGHVVFIVNKKERPWPINSLLDMAV